MDSQSEKLRKAINDILAQAQNANDCFEAGKETEANQALQAIHRIVGGYLYPHLR